MAADLPVRVVIADRPCRALEVAVAASVPEVLVDRSEFGGFGAAFDRDAYTEAITDALVVHGIDVVVMAGFGTVLGQAIHTAFPGRILNTHPALLPAFPGWHSVADALAAGVDETGTTVHIATLEMDAGPILAQASVPVLPDDTEATLHERIKSVERTLYPDTIRRFIDGLAVTAEDGSGSPNGGCTMRALLSVYDKTGLVELAAGLSELGWELISSGGTSAALVPGRYRPYARCRRSPAPPRCSVAGSRPCTRRSTGASWPTARCPSTSPRSNGTASTSSTWSSAISTRSRRTRRSSSSTSAGRPWCGRRRRTTITSGSWSPPATTPAILAELREHGSLSDATRRRLARDAFAHTAGYDAAIVEWLDERQPPAVHRIGRRRVRPPPPCCRPASTSPWNGPPRCATARTPTSTGPATGSPASTRGGTRWSSTVGKELSYLNVFDTDAAWRLVHELVADRGTDHAVAIIKHANPCGAALHADLAVAYQRALDCDPQSAFGGIVAIGGTVTSSVADAISAGPMADVIIAPSYEEEALARLAAKRKATRLLSAPSPEPVVRQIRSLGASVLVQDADRFVVEPSSWEVATKARPTEAQWRDLALAWKVCARTTSNAIAVVTDGQAVGVGAGQQSRVVAAEIAVAKAGSRAGGGAAASDAYFPFPDGLLVLADAGVAAVVQPGGSIRDAEVIAAADEAGVAMVMAGGERHFRH